MPGCCPEYFLRFMNVGRIRSDLKDVRLRYLPLIVLGLYLLVNRDYQQIFF